MNNDTTNSTSNFTSNSKLNVVKNKDTQTNVRNKTKNNCEHEWVKDLIDIDPDRSKEICYCIKCELTKK
jgi:hypothetical protein